MKLYGKVRRTAVQAKSLEEVTLVLNYVEIADLANFLMSCSEEMSTNPDWEHAHYSGPASRPHELVDLIVFASEKIS